MKDSIKKTKRQVPGWEKIFAVHISDKGIVSRINKEILKLVKDKQPFKKMGKMFEKILHKKNLY